MESPHVDLIEETGSVNFVKVDTETFTCGFDSSGKIENVTPVVPVTTETWYFNATIDSSITKTDVQFNTLDERFCECEGLFVDENITVMLYFLGDGSVCDVYNRGEWYSDYVRTIILDEPATGDLLTFLQANATKQ